jgi:putative peptidoglycan lipid II flippase
MKHLLKPTIILTVCTFLGQLVSFLINVISAKIFGANVEMDAYLAAQTLPNYISIVLLGGLSYVFIPTFIEHRTKNKEDEAWKIANSLVLIYLGLLSILALIGIVWAKPILKLSMPGLSGDALQLAGNLSIIVWPTTVLSGVLAILTSLYHAYEQFVYQAITTLISGILYVLMLLIFGNHQNGIFILSIGLLISTFVNVLFLIRIIGKQKKIQFNLKDKAVYLLFRLQLPIVLAAACSNATRLMDRFVSSSLPSGTISYLSYADKLKIAIASVLGGGISVTLFPLMARNFSQNNTNELRYNISFGLRVTCIIVMPVILIGSVLASPIIKLLFERGSFSNIDTYNVARLLPWFLLSIIGATMANVTSRVLYVLKETKVVAIIGIVEVILYVIYMPLLCNLLKGEGIAVAMMVLWNTSFLFQLFIIDSKYKLIDKTVIITGVSKIVLASLIPAILLKLLLPYSELSDVATIFFGAGACLILYVVLLYFFKIDEVLLIKNNLRFSRKTKQE